MPFPRPHVAEPIEYGNASSFWVEYPSGLVDLTRETHVPPKNNDETITTNGTHTAEPPLRCGTQLDVPVDGNRVVRMAKSRSAMVIVDMQKYAYFSSRAESKHNLCTQLLPASRPARSSDRFTMRHTHHERRDGITNPRHQNPMGVSS